MIIKSNSQAQTNIALSSKSSLHDHQNYVPFLMKSNRFKQSKNQSPPIGSYNISSSFNKKASPLQNKISHFILQAQKAKEQMGIFKSTKNRFQKVQNNVPSPTFYNLFNKNSLINEQKLKRRYNNKENTLLASHSRPKVCPSIPDKNHKYGYSLTNGQQKTIQKSLEQLQKQKQVRKSYLEGLVEQKSLKKESSYKDYRDSDIKKKLYQSTSKFIPRGGQTELFENKSKGMGHNDIKKPKYQHLYHSKGVLNANVHRYLGPGQYQINKKIFNSSERTQRHQFFGSTEVRFPEKSTQEDKGYSLLEMIKQNKKQEKSMTKHSSIQRFRTYNHKSIQNCQNVPGPGQYNPDDLYLKKSRGTAVFLQEKRFKEGKQIQGIQTASNTLLDKSRLKKQINFGNLKKQKIKSINKSYAPVPSNQIYGILSEGIQAGKYKQKYQKIYKDLGKFGQNQQITSWNNTKSQKNAHIKYLKNELAFISSPRQQNLSYTHIST